MELKGRVLNLCSWFVFIANLSTLDALPILDRDGTQAHLDKTVLPEQSHADSVPRDDLPDEFTNIATRIHQLHLRAVIQNDDIEKFLEDTIKEAFGKGGLDGVINDTKKSKRVKRREAKIATLIDALNDSKKNKRVKRQEVDIATLCPDRSCIGLLKQYEQWRKEHGYAYYTGVWKVGK